MLEQMEQLYALLEDPKRWWMGSQHYEAADENDQPVDAYDVRAVKRTIEGAITFIGMSLQNSNKYAMFRERLIFEMREIEPGTYGMSFARMNSYFTTHDSLLRVLRKLIENHRVNHALANK